MKKMLTPRGSLGRFIQNSGPNAWWPMAMVHWTFRRNPHANAAVLRVSGAARSLIAIVSAGTSSGTCQAVICEKPVEAHEWQLGFWRVFGEGRLEGS